MIHSSFWKAPGNNNHFPQKTFLRLNKHLQREKKNKKNGLRCLIYQVKRKNFLFRSFFGKTFWLENNFSYFLFNEHNLYFYLFSVLFIGFLHKSFGKLLKNNFIQLHILKIFLKIDPIWNTKNIKKII